MSFVPLEGGKLFYEVYGKGRWLVLLHGAWASHEWWRWLVPELSLFCRVLSYDLRGHGLSSPMPKRFSIDAFAQDLEILLQKAGIEEFGLVGWSLGGMIALQYCLKNPSGVKALILISTRGNRDPNLKRKIWFQHLRARLSLMLDLAAPRKYDRIAESFPGERERIEEDLGSMLGRATSPEVREWVKADLARHPRENYFGIAKSFWDWEAGEALAEIRAPTLILVGEKDDRTPPAFSHDLNEKIPDSQLVTVEDAGHCLPLERPERVAQEIVGFLKRIGY